MHRGGIVVPPMFASALLFALGIIFVLVLGLSSLHLLWWFPVIFVFGNGVLMFPAAVNVTMTCVALLAGPNPTTIPSNEDDRRPRTWHCPVLNCVGINL